MAETSAVHPIPDVKKRFTHRPWGTCRCREHQAGIDNDWRLQHFDQAPSPLPRPVCMTLPNDAFRNLRAALHTPILNGPISQVRSHRSSLHPSAIPEHTAWNRPHPMGEAGSRVTERDRGLSQTLARNLNPGQRRSQDRPTDRTWCALSSSSGSPNHPR